MITRNSSALLAALVGMAALVSPLIGQAATVGYCGSSSIAAAITTAGHTPVSVATINATTLSTLDALYYENCGTPYSDAAIASAVHGGMSLIIQDWSASNAGLPGASGVVVTFGPGADIDLPPGSPILTGPGGTLTNTSLDGGNWSYHGYAALATLPAGSTVLDTSADPAQVVTFAYSYGSGRVVYSTTPLSWYYGPGSVAAFRTTYAPNVIAWAAGPSFTSCADEGFSGTKLTLCRQVCEMHYTGTKLNALIRTWTSLYHEDPPCAR